MHHYRMIKRDGELVQQQREVWIIDKSKWWKPWERELEFDHSIWVDTPIPEYNTLRVGDRVTVIAGFNVGASGEIQFIEPRGKIWVLRDNTNSPVYYVREELKLIWRRPNE